MITIVTIQFAISTMHSHYYNNH